MIVDEALAESGEPVCYRLLAEKPGFVLREGDERVGVYSAKIISDVVERYARPLDEEMQFEGETLPLAPGASLMAWYYKSPVDLENKLYLLLLREDQEPIAVLSRQVVSALRFLARPPTP